MCEGHVRDFELDLMKWLIESKGMRFIRNNDHQTPVTLIKAYPQKKVNYRGSVNMRKQTAEYFDDLLTNQPDLEDTEKNHEIHLAII